MQKGVNLLLKSADIENTKSILVGYVPWRVFPGKNGCFD